MGGEKEFWEDRRKERVKVFRGKRCPPMEKIRRRDKLP